MNPPTVCAVQKLSLIRRIGVLAGVLVLSMGTLAALTEVGRFRDAEYGLFRDRSIELAFVLADSAGSWIVRDNMDALAVACDVLLAGSATYVRVLLRGEAIVDRRSDEAALSHVKPHFFPGIDAVTTPMSEFDTATLHVAVPIEWSGEQGAPIGSVQIGFDDSFARERVRSFRRLIAGIVAGSWLAFLLIGVLAIRHFTNVAHEHVVEAEPMPQAGGHDVIRTGALEIDVDICRVCLNHQEVQLTPKMFELLLYLARQPRRIFSDSDLLAALWEDAPYATSSDVKQCVYVLRQRLGVAHPNPKAIVVNVKGFGYKLEPPTEHALIEK